MQTAAARKAGRPRKNGSAVPSPRRSPLTFVDPEDLVIVGEESALFDGDRAALPVREEDVASVLYYGVAEPVVARINAGRVEVVSGVQRVRWAREASRRLRERGERPMRVPVVFRMCDDREAVGLAVSLNEIRKDDSIYVKAQKAGRMIKLGMTQTEVGIAFGVSNSAISYWLSMLRLAPELQPFAADGRLQLSDAIKLHRLDHDEQVRAFAEIERARGGAASREEPQPPTSAEAPSQETAASTGRHSPPPPQLVEQDGSSFRPRLRDLAVYITEVDPGALDPAWSLLLLWLDLDESTTEEMVAAALPRLRPFFTWRHGSGEP